MNRATINDVLIVTGVMLLGASVLWLAGWPGLLGYAGALLLVLGVALAGGVRYDRRRTTRRERRRWK